MQSYTVAAPHVGPQVLQPPPHPNNAWLGDTKKVRTNMEETETPQYLQSEQIGGGGEEK